MLLFIFSANLLDDKEKAWGAMKSRFYGGHESDLDEGEQFYCCCGTKYV
jgi:hypothetical protein